MKMTSQLRHQDLQKFQTHAIARNNMWKTDSGGVRMVREIQINPFPVAPTRLRPP